MKTLRQHRAILGESPIWDPNHQCFFWVDIKGNKIFSVDSKGDNFKMWSFDDHVCAIVPAEDKKCLVAFTKQLAWFDPLTGITDLIDGTKVRTKYEMYNDGYVDAKGRLWIGSKDINEQQPLAKLYCFDGQQHRVMDEAIIISNGIDWSLDNSAMYLADSPKQIIYCYDFELRTGNISNKIPFIKVSNGYPDGMVVDEDGFLWSAHWDGYGLSQYDSNGNLKAFHKMPAQRITSCCFGGENYQNLLITSASYNLAYSNTDNGYAFLLHGIGKGRATNLFRSVL